jgi:carbonic anhydrase/acetyltransferase-like protein (isoleucine patch superfamily)
MPTCRFGAAVPRIPASAYVAPDATLIGDVTLGEAVSVWPGTVIRADNDAIRIGDNTNIQDGAVLHVDPGCPMSVGANVTVGHQAMLHGCTIGDGTLVGIQAIVLNNAVIGRDSLIAAGAIVTEGKRFPDRSLILGAPAKVHRQLTDADVAELRRNIDGYVQRGKAYRTELERIG